MQRGGCSRDGVGCTGKVQEQPGRPGDEILACTAVIKPCASDFVVDWWQLEL